MNEDSKEMVIIATVAVVIVSCLLGSSYLYSGSMYPYSVVISGSMMHSEDSQLGVIDTGDMVYVRQPGKMDIQSYYDGLQSGYSSFGEYGDVVVYYRNGSNPVIHRAILWLNYNGESNPGTWSAPALENLDNSTGTYWSTSTGSGEWNELQGILTLKNIGYGSKNVDINLSYLRTYSTSLHGFLTMGDNNATNTHLDQDVDASGHFAVTGCPGLIGDNQIKSVAVGEIPWVGCIKMLINNNNTEDIPSNSIPCLCLAIFMILMFIPVLSVILDWLFLRKDGKHKK